MELSFKLVTNKDTKEAILTFPTDESVGILFVVRRIEKRLN